MPPRPRNSHLLDQVRLGDEIEVWWPHDAQYYSGVVGCCLPSGRYRILYNDGEVEDLRLAAEQWRFIGSAAQRVLASSSTPPPLDAASPEPNSDASPKEVKPPPQASRLSETTSGSKTASTKKRTKANNRKSDVSKPVTPKTAKAKKPSSTPNDKTADTSHPAPASGTPPTPQITTPKVKKRQRSSSMTVQLEKSKLTKTTGTLRDPPSQDPDSGLIDPAPLDMNAKNVSSTPQPSAAAPKNSNAPVPDAANHLNTSEKIDTLRRKIFSNSRESAPVVPVTPPGVPVTKPSTANASGVLGDTSSTAASGNCPPTASSSDHRALHSRASKGPGLTENGSIRGNDSSASSGVRAATNQDKVTTSPASKQQLLAATGREKPPAKTPGTSDKPKKARTSTPVLDTEALPGAGQSGSSHVQKSVSRLVLLAQSGTHKPNSSNKSLEKTLRLSNGHAAPDHASRKTPAGGGVGDKGRDAAYKKNKNQSGGSQDVGESCAARPKLPNASGQDGPKPNEPSKEDSPRNQSKGPLQSAQGGCAESNATPKGIAAGPGPALALMARVTENAEQRRPVLSTSSRSASSRLDTSRSHPPPAKLRGTGSPRKGLDSLARRGSRPKADVKGSPMSRGGSQSKGGSVAKLPVVQRSISKPAKSVLQRQTMPRLLPRPQGEANDHRAAVNPDDGRDIIADVNVPRKARGGTASPLLSSPGGGLRLPLASPVKTGSISPGRGPKPVNGVDLKSFSLQQPVMTGVSVRGDRSPLEQGDRSGGKHGPFQPTKRRSELRRQATIHRAKQRSLTDSNSRTTHAQIPHQSPSLTRESGSGPLSTPSRSDCQHEALTPPALRQNVPVRANQVKEKQAQRSSIPGPRLEVPSTRHASSNENQAGRNSTALKKSVSPSPAQTKSSGQRQPPAETTRGPVDRSKSGLARVENLIANSTLTGRHVVDKPGNLSVRPRTVPRVDHRQGSVVGNEGSNTRASASPTAAPKTSANPETDSTGNSGTKRAAQGYVNVGKRRKLDSPVKHDLKQAAKAMALAAESDSNSHAPKTISQRSSSPYQQSTEKKPDGTQHQQLSNSLSQKTLADGASVPRTAQTQQPPHGNTNGDTSEKRRDEGTAKPEKPNMLIAGRHQRSGSSLDPPRSCERNDSDMRGDIFSPGKTQSRPLDGLRTKGTNRSRVVESGPAAVNAGRAAGSTAATAALQSSQSRPERKGSSGTGVPNSSTPQPSTVKPSIETITQAPTSAIRDVPSDGAGEHHPRTESQSVQKCPNPRTSTAAPIMPQQLQPPGVKDGTTGAHESQPSYVAQRSFSRVRSRQSTGSLQENRKSKSTASATQIPNKNTASFPLDVIMRAVTETNKTSLQSRLAPLSSRFEKFFADNDRLLRSLQGEMDKASKTTESLRDDLGEVRDAVSDFPSIAEIKTFLEVHAEESRRELTNEMKTVISEVKEDLRHHLARQLESAMKNVAAQIQRDSVMLISKAIDNAMNSGLMQDHPRIADGNREAVCGERERGEAIRIGGNGANSTADTKYAGMDRDDIPLAHRFGRMETAWKEQPSNLSGSVSAGLPEAGGQSHPKEPAEKGASSSAKPLSHGPTVEAEGNVPSLNKRPGGVTLSSVGQQHSGCSLAGVVHDGVACLGSTEGGNGNRKSVQKETIPVTPAISHSAQEKSAQSKGQFALPSRVANAPRPQDSKASGHSPYDAMEVLRVRDSGLEPTGLEPVAKNPGAPRASVPPPSSSNASETEPETPIGHRALERHQQKTTMARRARRESYEQLTHQARILLARCAVEWFLSGGCRDFAPPNERVLPVTDEWVNKSARRCLDGIANRLEKQGSFERAMKELVDSVGPEIKTDWLLDGPTVSNIDQARKNYDEWDPQLYDFEWESEKRVLAILSGKLISSEQNLVRTGEIFEDPLYTARRYVEGASKRNATQSTE